LSCPRVKNTLLLREDKLDGANGEKKCDGKATKLHIGYGETINGALFKDSEVVVRAEDG
jgi:hypothetical protein